MIHIIAMELAVAKKNTVITLPKLYKQLTPHKYNLHNYFA
jgi:hypothetical protein